MWTSRSRQKWRPLQRSASGAQVLLEALEASRVADSQGEVPPRIAHAMQQLHEVLGVLTTPAADLDGALPRAQPRAQAAPVAESGCCDIISEVGNEDAIMEELEEVDDDDHEALLAAARRWKRARRAAQLGQ